MLNGMGAADDLRASFGHSEVLHFTFADQLSYGSRDIFDRNFRVDTMLIKQVNCIDLQAVQGSLRNFPDSLGAAIEPLRGNAIHEAELCRNYWLVLDRCERFAKQFFIRERAVRFGSIEECHACVVRSSDQLDRRCFFGRRPIAEAEPHATESESRNLKPALAQLSLLHTPKLAVLIKASPAKHVNGSSDHDSFRNAFRGKLSYWYWPKSFTIAAMLAALGGCRG
jgi:hypothetical protein